MPESPISGGTAMMAGQVLGAGLAAGLGAECIREQAAFTIKRAKEYQDSWNNIITSEGEIDTIEKANIIAMVDDMAQINAQTKLAREIHSKAIKTIDMMGIVGISIIFFLLLLKTFGLIEPLITMVAFPFTYVYKKLK